MKACYYEFDFTGCEVIDNILAKVAKAGELHHHTSDWNEYIIIAEIQKAAEEAADHMEAVANVTVVNNVVGRE